MRIFNYAAYAKAFELGVSKPNMTKIAKALFEPIVSFDGVVNHVGNLYTIDPKSAKAWYEQTKDIPENIKIAAGNPMLVNAIGNYFSEKIIDNVVNQLQESEMYSAMIKLITESDLEQEQKDELLNYYSENERAEFLGKTFLYAIVRDNLQKNLDITEEP